MDLTELSARLEIADVLTRYTRAVDTKTFADLEHVFTADAVLDYSSVGGPVGSPAEVVPWVAQGLAGFARHQHMLGQLDILFTGDDEAEVTAYFTNPMVSVGPGGVETLWEVGGYYHHTVRRTPEGWRSVRMVDEMVWSRST